jgi:hypothetical protein
VLGRDSGKQSEERRATLAKVAAARADIEAKLTLGDVLLAVDALERKINAIVDALVDDESRKMRNRDLVARFGNRKRR